MTIKFEDALGTLTEMFPHLPPDAVKNCLVQNKGHMENTVTMLLSSPPSAFLAPQPRSQPARSRPMANPPRQQVWGQPAPRPAPVRHQPQPRQPPPQQHNLAEDFLRPPSYFFSKYQVPNVQDPNMLDEDAILAKVLQDSLFMSQLKENPEWVLQQQQQPPKSSPKPSDIANPVPYEARIRGQGSDGNQRQSVEQKNFASKFSNLGAAARQKLTRLAAGFERNKGGKYQSLETPPATNNVGQYKPPEQV